MPVEDSDFPPDAEVASLPPAATSTVPRGPLGDDDPSHHVLEPHRDPAEEANGTEEAKTPIAEFDPRVKDEFEGLLYLGRLTDEFEAFGHTFIIRTLSTDEVLEVGLLHKPYKDTISEIKAYQAALVAACVVSVDGKQLPIPITNEPHDTALANRFHFVKRSWFPPLLDIIYERFLLLETKVDDALTAMGNRSR